MKTFFLRLFRDDQGAEFVEWVVTVALIGITAFAVVVMIQGEIADLLSWILKVGSPT